MSDQIRELVEEEIRPRYVRKGNIEVLTDRWFAGEEKVHFLFFF